MIVSLSVLSYKEQIDIDEDIVYSLDDLKDSPIQKLSNVHARGYIYQNAIEEYIADIDVKGIMTLLDSVSNEPIELPFSFTIEDNLEPYLQKSENLLDIKELLWQNIVLEVPIRYTQKDASKLKGDHWKVIDETSSEETIDPRLQKLNDIYKGGE
jgi:uncharacterized metal-binding protein YceD (DUF177 family)